MFRRINALLAVLFIVTALFTPALAAPDTPDAPGDLDTSFAGFGVGGSVTQTGVFSISDVALQPDGKIVASGYKEANILVVMRYLPNGQPDYTFDGDGKAELPDMFSVVRLALQSDGRVVVGGTRNDDFQLARLTNTGALDLSFDGDGWFEDADGELEQLGALLVQPDDKIVACGKAHVGGDDDFGVTRYNTDGSRDNTFGGDGKVTIGFGGDDECRDVVRQSDGKLVVVGSMYDGSGIEDDVDFAVARLNLNGSLDNNSDGDSGFDGDGKLTTGFGGGERAESVALQSDGKIVVLGDLNDDHSCLARYNPDGSLDDDDGDGGFGSGGKVRHLGDRLRSLAVQPDGKLMLLGNHDLSFQNYRFVLQRLDQNGAPDLTFGSSDGRAQLAFSGYSSALALLADGRILTAGAKGNAGAVVRLWPDGTYDSGGKQTHSLAFPPVYPSGSDATTWALATQPDGKLLVAGELRNPSGNSSDAFVTRFFSSGRLDTSFGDQGTSRLWVGNFNSARAIAVQPNGQIVIAGYADWGGSIVTFLVARFNADGSLDDDFAVHGNARGYQVVSFTFPNPNYGPDYGMALALAPDGKIVVAGNVWGGSQMIWGVARLTSAGQPDTTFGANHDGKALVNFNAANAAKAVVVQPDGKVIVGGDYNGDFFLQRLLENGLPDPSYGINGGGYNFTDMGGTDSITALALAPNGWLYAAGYTWRGGADDFALAQYRPDGTLAVCPTGQTCNYWPEGKHLVSLGGSDSAYALVLRDDDQLVAAGCSDWHMAAVQVSTTDVNAPVLEFETGFGGHFDCAFGVQFSNANRNQIVLAGLQAHSVDGNIALARFQTASYTPPTYRVFMPVVLR